MERSEACVGPVSKKPRQEDDKEEQEKKPLCLYGSSCFRRGPDHLRAYRHPKRENDYTTSLPPCKYGAHCYDRNLLHFAMFYHPTVDVSKSATTSIETVNSRQKRKDLTLKTQNSREVDECLIENDNVGRWVCDSSPISFSLVC